MKKSRQNKGITLIALIITIIVMLILVGVTINVALNGGLFQKAEYASEQMQIKADEEELLSAVVASIGNDGKVGNIVLPAGWDKLENGNYKSPKDNIFKVHPNGKIEYIGKYTGGGSGGNTPVAFKWEDVGLTVDTNTEYICDGYSSLNFSADGKLTAFSQGIPALTIDATKYTETGKIDFTEGVEAVLGQKGRIKVEMNGNKTDIDLTIIYLGDDGITEEETEVNTCVKVSLEKDSETGIKKVYSNAEVLQALGATGGTYKGTWTVIERDASGKPTKLVSTSDVTSCTLGEDDNLDKSISDYKNAVSTLNTSAQQATGITSARSITVEDIETLAGIQDSDKGDNYNQPYTYNYTNHKDQVFVNESGATVKIDSEGKEVTLKNTYYYKELSSDDIGTLASGYYWLASPCVSCNSDRAAFGVRYVDYGYIYCNYLFNSDGRAYGNCGSFGVRAVVSVSGL